MTTVNELAKLVRAMRDAQNDYFQARTRTALHVAKILERKVDRIVLQVLGEAAAEQENLFDQRAPQGVGNSR